MSRALGVSWWRPAPSGGIMLGFCGAAPQESFQYLALSPSSYRQQI